MCNVWVSICTYTCSMTMGDRWLPVHFYGSGKNQANQKLGFVLTKGFTFTLCKIKPQCWNITFLIFSSKGVARQKQRVFCSHYDWNFFEEMWIIMQHYDIFQYQVILQKIYGQCTYCRWNGKLRAALRNSLKLSLLLWRKSNIILCEADRLLKYRGR